MWGQWREAIICRIMAERSPEFKLTNIGMNGTCEPADDDPWDISRDGLAEERLPKVDLSTLYQGFLCLTET